MSTTDIYLQLCKIAFICKPGTYITLGGDLVQCRNVKKEGKKNNA